MFFALYDGQGLLRTPNHRQTSKNSTYSRSTTFTRSCQGVFWCTHPWWCRLIYHLMICKDEINHKSENNNLLVFNMTVSSTTQAKSTSQSPTNALCTTEEPRVLSPIPASIPSWVPSSTPFATINVKKFTFNKASNYLCCRPCNSMTHIVYSLETVTGIFWSVTSS